jgi:cephalosporin hydroxylase
MAARLRGCMSPIVRCRSTSYSLWPVEKAEIEAVYATHWRPGWGSIAPDEVLYVQELITKLRPNSFIEIGTASGLSGGLIARLMDENGGGEFTTIDHDNTFFGDNTKENGFLLRHIYDGTRVRVEQRAFTTALDIATLGSTYEMAFVDANHQHPWPLIDTLCLYPCMAGPRVVVHHDLALFRKQAQPIGLGPKYLFDQFPSSHRQRSTAGGGNIFSVSLDLPVRDLEQIASDAFYLPWSLRAPLTSAVLDKFRAVLKFCYSDDLVTVFNECVRRFNRSR